MFATWTDLAVLISKLTFKRIINGLNVVNSYLMSRITRNSRMKGFPISLAMEPTTSCNLRCPECPSGLRSFTRPTGMLSLSSFKSMVDQMAPTTPYLTFYFQGEPYLNPDLFEMVAYANQKKMYTATSTNAHYLDDEQAKATIDSGLSRLIISMDGTDQDTYSAYRKGGSLDKVIEGTKNMIRWKRGLKSSTPVIIWQFLVVRPNEHQIDEVKKLGKEIGVDKVALKTAQVYDYKNGHDLIPTLDQYSRYRKNQDGTFAIKNRLLDHCWKMWSSCVVTWDGQVVPCCFDKDAQHVLGDLRQKSFESIWFSKPYSDFRAQLIRSRSEIDMCKNCSVGTKVWA